MKTMAILFATSIALAIAMPAHADEHPWVLGSSTAPREAFELTVGTGYTQPFGSLERGIGMPSVATPGQGLEIGFGYRMTERWSLALSGQFAELTAERSHGARIVTTSATATYHLRPNLRFDPWIDVASGYRRLWETSLDQRTTIVTQGLQVVRVRGGLDFREGSMAAGPVLGADANVFLWQDANDAMRTIAAPRLSVFVFAGVQGRWDLQ